MSEPIQHGTVTLGSNFNFTVSAGATRFEVYDHTNTSIWSHRQHYYSKRFVNVDIISFNTFTPVNTSCGSSNSSARLYFADRFNRLMITGKYTTLHITSVTIRKPDRMEVMLDMDCANEVGTVSWMSISD